MIKSGMAVSAFVMAAVFQSTAAQAASLVFTGTMNATGTGAPDPSCAPLPLHGTTLPGSTGSSSLGSFSYGHSACIPGPAPGPFHGLSFVVDFGVDQFSGTFDGLGTLSATPGVFDAVFNYMVLGGTGRFLDASGGFTGIGTIDTRTLPVRLTFAFDGLINAPAVPEPATWAVMVLGVWFVGWGMRSAKSRARTTLYAGGKALRGMPAGTMFG